MHLIHSIAGLAFRYDSPVKSDSDPHFRISCFLWVWVKSLLGASPRTPKKSAFSLQGPHAPPNLGPRAPKMGPKAPGAGTFPLSLVQGHAQCPWTRDMPNVLGPGTCPLSLDQGHAHCPWTRDMPIAPGEGTCPTCGPERPRVQFFCFFAAGPVGTTCF